MNDIQKYMNDIQKSDLTAAQLQKHIKVITDFNAAPLEISTNEEYVACGNVLKKLSESIKLVEKYFEDDKRDTYAVYKAVLDSINTTKQPLEEAKSKTKRAMDDYNARQKRLAAEKQKEIEGREDAPIQVTAQTPKVAGVKSYRTWKWRVTDRLKVPREYLTLDEKKITATMREFREQTRIPGIEVYETEEVRG